jgi:tetratricopeptide (TPR) repeat protein
LSKALSKTLFGTEIMKFVVITILLLLVRVDDPSAHFAKGKSHLQSKDYIDAINEFTTAVSINPNFGEAYYYRALSKDMMSKEGGFIIHDLCVDLILAVENGYQAALSMLRDKSDQFCHNLKAAIASPDAVFCAEFSSSVLSELPKSFSQMILLVNLRLFNNRFESLPDLSSSQYLVYLDASSNSISVIPEHLAKLKWLMHLNFSRNKIDAIPNSIANLKNLQELILKENHLEEIPQTLAQVKSLETLDVSFNRIKAIPGFMETMTHLKTLILTGNPISDSQVNELKKKLKNTRIYF